eukprot:15164318-Alexandrium_andersonii.AAC.1
MIGRSIRPSHAPCPPETLSACRKDEVASDNEQEKEDLNENALESDEQDGDDKMSDKRSAVDTTRRTCR